MTRVECGGCRQSFPMNETVRVGERPLCRPCADSDLSVAAEVHHDPTVCAACSGDFGSSVLGTLQSGVPVCEPCREKLLHRPYPQWVKLSFAAVVLLAVASAIVNWRFTTAYFDFRKAMHEFRAGHYETAAGLMRSASARAPEAEDLKHVSSLYTGIYYLMADDSTKALPYLRQVRDRTPDETAKSLMLQAEIGAAFDGHDYDLFLTKSQQLLQDRPSDPMAVAGVASAYACRYAAAGDPAMKANSLEFLRRAKALSADPAQYAEYEGRILYRLTSREVINSAEYKKRFPNGWKGGAQ